MPRIRRWFHVSHDINSDPEVWELTDRFGERALRVWLQMLSVADRNNGRLKGSPSDWCQTLLRLFSEGNQRWIRRDSERLLTAIRWMSEKGWIRIREGSDACLEVVNYWKYNTTRDAKPAPLGAATASPPLLSSPLLSSSTKKNPPPPLGGLNGFGAFWTAYPRKKSKGQAEKAWKKLQPNEQLQGILLAALQRAKTSADWTKERGEFIPYPATWLNAKGWEDEIRAEEGPNADLPEARPCKACGGIHSWKAGQRLEPCPQDPRGESR